MANTSQISVRCAGALPPMAWTYEGDQLPIISGSTRVPKSFTPTRILLTEIVTAKFDSASYGPVRLSCEVEDCGDLVVLSISESRDGGIELLQGDSQRFGIPGLGLARRWHDIRWPVIHGGSEISVKMAIEPTALYRIKPLDGFMFDDMDSVYVKAHLVLFGEQVEQID